MEIEEYTRYYLRNLYQNYIMDRRAGLSQPESKIKIFGGMEALLIILNKLESGQPYQFKDRKETLNFLWVKIPYTSRESYEEFILRHVEEVLKIEKNGK